MKKYYIIRADGTSIFEQSYPEDFIFHCLIMLLDSTPDALYTLCEIDMETLNFASLSAKKMPKKDFSSNQSGWLCWRSEQ